MPYILHLHLPTYINHLEIKKQKLFDCEGGWSWGCYRVAVVQMCTHVDHRFGGLIEKSLINLENVKGYLFNVSKCLAGTIICVQSYANRQSIRAV